MKIQDKELGIININANHRAINVIARFKEGEFHITHPVGMNVKEVRRLINEMKPRLISMKEKSKPGFVFAPDSEFKSLTFSVHLQEHPLDTFRGTYTNNMALVKYPQTYKYTDPQVQKITRSYVEGILRYEAHKIFPEKVKLLAERYNYTYLDLKINKSRSRWGSCSGEKNINLSFFCLLLPEHFIDFVILHELCHTIEMNHSARFWALLDKVTDNKARELTTQLKAYPITW